MYKTYDIKANFCFLFSKVNSTFVKTMKKFIFSILILLQLLSLSKVKNHFALAQDNVDFFVDYGLPGDAFAFAEVNETNGRFKRDRVRVGGGIQHFKPFFVKTLFLNSYFV